MSDVLYFGAIVMSVVNIGLGLFVGQKLAASRTRRLSEEVDRLNELTFNQVEAHSRRVDAVNRRIGRDTSVLTPLEQEIRDAIEQLLEANHALQADLQRTRQDLQALRTKGLRTERAESPAPSVVLESSDQDGRQETSQRRAAPTVVRTDLTPQSPDANRRIQTQPYRVQQQIASYDSGRLPGPADFFTVQCWDISWEGFSFLADHPPTFKTIVALLGNELERKFFSARVTRVSEFSERGRAEFQVSCQFTGRLHHHLFSDALTVG